MRETAKKETKKERRKEGKETRGKKVNEEQAEEKCRQKNGGLLRHKRSNNRVYSLLMLITLLAIEQSASQTL